MSFKILFFGKKRKAPQVNVDINSIPTGTALPAKDVYFDDQVHLPLPWWQWATSTSATTVGPGKLSEAKC